MYRLIFIMLLSASIPVMAQPDQPKQKKSSQPDNLVPLPEVPELPSNLSDPPPTPPDIQGDPELESQVTIIKRGEDTIEEHRVNGELLMIKVIPRIGPPYYLKKNTVGSNPVHTDEPGINVSPPMWQLFKF